MSNRSDDELFSRSVSQLGKRSVLDLRLPPATRSFYGDLSLQANDLISSARQGVPGLPEILFGFVVDAEVNAFATRHDDRYLIGINTGFLYLLRLLVGRMLSDRTLFTHVGDPEAELPDVPRIDHYVPHADQMWASEDLTTPQHEVRRAYAHHITERALLFFVGHEIAHISRGHVDYWQHERQLKVYSERSGPLQDAERVIERQCLELDADRRSIMASVNSLRDTQQDPEFRGLPWGDGPNDAAGLFKDWSVTIATVFQMLGNQRISDVDLTKSYPPILVRWRYAESLARQGIDLFWPPEKKALAAQAISLGRAEIAQALETVTGNLSPTEEPELPIAEFLEALSDYWKNVLVEKLRRYSYEPM